MVCGSSWTIAWAKPRCREPRAGESLRAKAIWAAMPLPRSRAGRHETACDSRWESANAALTRAWAPAAAAVIDSNSAIWSMRSESSTPVSRKGRHRSTSRRSSVVNAGSTRRRSANTAVIARPPTPLRTGVPMVPGGSDNPRSHRHSCDSVASVQPPSEVLDLFAVPEDPRPLLGGQGRSFVAGDLVLSPGRDPFTCSWLNPVLARLAVELDTTRHRAVRIAMPIPSRDGRWVVDGWGASRYEPDTQPCRDLDVLVATARLLHARLASALPLAPEGIRGRTDRWARAAAAAFDPSLLSGVRPTLAGPLVAEIVAGLHDADLGPDQLVHGDLA